MTENDRKRIEEFAERPAYMRRPEMLMPGEPDGEET